MQFLAFAMGKRQALRRQCALLVLIAVFVAVPLGSGWADFDWSPSLTQRAGIHFPMRPTQAPSAHEAGDNMEPRQLEMLHGDLDLTLILANRPGNLRKIFKMVAPSSSMENAPTIPIHEHFVGDIDLSFIAAQRHPLPKKVAGVAARKPLMLDQLDADLYFADIDWSLISAKRPGKHRSNQEQQAPMTPPKVYNTEPQENAMFHGDLDLNLIMAPRPDSLRKTFTTEATSTALEKPPSVPTDVQFIGDIDLSFIAAQRHLAPKKVAGVAAKKSMVLEQYDPEFFFADADWNLISANRAGSYGLMQKQEAAKAWQPTRSIARVK